MEKLFRFWDDNESQFVVFDLQELADASFDLGYYGDAEQWTGLYDREDNAIYENDIVERFDYGEGVCKVVWYEDDAGFGLENINSTWIDAWYSHERWYQLLVVGNIYENPELLE